MSIGSQTERPRVDREAYNYKYEHAQIWCIDQEMYEKLPSKLQKALSDVLQAGADASACLDRVKAAEEQVEDRDDCYDMANARSNLSSEEGHHNHRHMERSDEEVQMFPCSPIIGATERSGLSSNASPGFTSSSSFSGDDLQSPFERATQSSFFSPALSPSISGNTAMSPIDIASPLRRHSPRGSTSLRSSFSQSQAAGSPPIIRARRTSTTRFAHHMDLRTQTYVGEIHHYRYTCIPRLRHSMRRLRQQWENTVRQGKLLAQQQQQRRDSFLPEVPIPDEFAEVDTMKVSMLISANDEVSVVLEKWMNEKGDYWTFLENRSTEMGVGLDVGLGWGTNGAVAWT